MNNPVPALIVKLFHLFFLKERLSLLEIKPLKVPIVRLPKGSHKHPLLTLVRRHL